MNKNFLFPTPHGSSQCFSGLFCGFQRGCSPPPPPAAKVRAISSVARTDGKRKRWLAASLRSAVKTYCIFGSKTNWHLWGKENFYSIKADISLLDSKIEKLMSAYLESALSLEEYREAKNKLVNQNQLLKEKLSAFLQKANNRFELTEKFLKFNTELANDRTNEENTHLFKKVGSNFQMKDRTVLFEPRGAWKILSDSEFFGGNALVSRLRRDPISALKSDFVFWR